MGGLIRDNVVTSESKVPFLGEIPLVQSICESGDKGMPIAMDDSSPITKAFAHVAETIAQQIAIRNAFTEDMAL